MESGRDILVTAGVVQVTPFVNGITEFEPGAEVAFHSHDCAESALVLNGDARFELEDDAYEMLADDVTFVPAGIPHRFVNVGSDQMRLFLVYGSEARTRTMLDSGETFPIGSEHDVSKSRS